MFYIAFNVRILGCYKSSTPFITVLLTILFWKSNISIVIKNIVGFLKSLLNEQNGASKCDRANLPPSMTSRTSLCRPQKLRFTWFLYGCIPSVPNYYSLTFLIENCWYESKCMSILTKIMHLMKPKRIVIWERVHTKGSRKGMAQMWFSMWSTDIVSNPWQKNKNPSYSVCSQFYSGQGSITFG
jgi:hypothetical protein